MVIDPAPSDTPQGKVALQFAQALVARNFVDAQAMLTPFRRSSLTPIQLQIQFEAMLDYWQNKVVNFVDVITILDEWPDRQATDWGWAYVAIGGDGDHEAVTVVVTEMDGQPLIRSIEWGRP